MLFCKIIIQSDFLLLGEFHKPFAVRGQPLVANRGYSSLYIYISFPFSSLPPLAILIFLSHIILFLHLSCYFRTIFQRHKPVPQMVQTL